MDFSVIIPTLNRPRALQETLISIKKQKLTPKEIIVVDQSDNEDTKKMCKEDRMIKYFHSDIKSASNARNIGIDAACSEILFFLDDDMELDKDYFNTILKAYKYKSDAVCIQPWIKNTTHFGMVSNIIRTFFLFEHEKKHMDIMDNFIGNSFKAKPETIKKIDWCSGGAFSTRKEIAELVKFEKQFLLYSLAEDRDFSFRCKKYGNLYLEPKASILHKEEEASKINNRKKTRMIYVHQMYLISKNLSWNLKTSSAYWWNVFGRLLIKIISLTQLKKKNLEDLKNNWDSFVYVLSKKQKIISGDISDFNQWLIQKER